MHESKTAPSPDLDFTTKLQFFLASTLAFDGHIPSFDF